MAQALEEIAVTGIPADALLPVADDLHLGPEPGHEAQHHGQDQRHGRDDPPEEVDELVRGHHFIIGSKPDDHRDQHDPHDEAVGDGLQGDRVAVAQVAQDVDAVVVEQRVGHHGDDEDDGHAQEVELDRLAPPQGDEGVDDGGGQPHGHEGGVLEEHAEEDDDQEVEEVDGGMIS